MQKLNFFEFSYTKDSEIYQDQAINYSEKINKLLNYLKNFNYEEKKYTDEKEKENEKDIYLAISLLSGVFFGDAFGSYHCDKSQEKSENKFNEDLMWTYNPYFGTSKAQVTDSSEMCLSLAYGLIDSFDFDENLISFFYHYWYYSPAFNIEKSSNNAFNLFRSEMKIFNNYIRKKSNLSEICLKNAQTYNDNTLSNGFLIRHSPFFIDFFFRNKSKILEYCKEIIFSNCEFSMEKLFKFTYTNSNKEVILSHSFSENTFAASFYDYILSLIFSFSYFGEKIFKISTTMDQKNNKSDDIPLTKFEKICEIIIIQIKNLLNCEFIKLYHTEKRLLDRINRLGTLIKRYSIEEIINRINFTTNEADNDTENYISSIELMILILFNSKRFLGNDVIDENSFYKNEEINLTNKTEENNTLRYINENLKHNTFRNILNFISKHAGNNTNRNCAIIGGVFSSILGFGNIDKEIFDVFSFLPFMGYSYIENGKFKLKNLKINSSVKTMIKHRPFMYSPGIILLWVIYQKAKIDGNLERFFNFFLNLFIYFFSEFGFFEFMESILQKTNIKGDMKKFSDLIN